LPIHEGIREMVRTALETAGCHVLVARDGEEVCLRLSEYFFEYFVVDMFYYGMLFRHIDIGEI
jgi:PleD family two-component response regulator